MYLYLYITIHSGLLVTGHRVQTVKYLMFVPSGMFIAVTSSAMQGAHPLIIYQDGPEPPCMAGVRPNGYRLASSKN